MLACVSSLSRPHFRRAVAAVGAFQSAPPSRRRLSCQLHSGGHHGRAFRISTGGTNANPYAKNANANAIAIAVGRRRHRLDIGRHHRTQASLATDLLCQITATTMNPLVNLLTMDFPYATETVCIFMAIQGSMAVRNGPNRRRTMHWFHAFLRSTLTAYAGATFTNIFMGRPTKMFSDDVFFGSCLIGYAIVNWLPFDLGYMFFDSPPGQLLHTVFSQIFRVGGVTGFSDAAYGMFKDAPSVYYPTPVFGPILFPTALGNMGGFLWNGFDGYLENGMPWMFQQGMSCATFYHFYAHDAEGYVGVQLRSVLKPVATQAMLLLGADEKESTNDKLFATFAVAFFMVVMAIVRMPQLLGPKFSPFVALSDMVGSVLGGKKKKVNAKPPGGKKNKKKTQ